MSLRKESLKFSKEIVKCWEEFQEKIQSGDQLIRDQSEIGEIPSPAACCECCYVTKEILDRNMYSTMLALLRTRRWKELNAIKGRYLINVNF